MAVGHQAIVKTPQGDVWQGVLRDEAATQSFAESLARQAGVRHAFIALHGGLGAGKTTFTRHLLHALGVLGRVKSPSYAVVEPYTVQLDGRELDIWHFDFYRFNDPNEWTDAGFRDIFASSGLKLAEWPDQAAPHLPVADLRLTLTVQSDESRAFTLTAPTPLGLSLLNGMALLERTALQQGPVR